MAQGQREQQQTPTPVASPTAAAILEHPQQQADTQLSAQHERLNQLYAQYPGKRPVLVAQEIAELEKLVEEEQAAKAAEADQANHAAAAAAAESQAAAAAELLAVQTYRALDRALVVLQHTAVKALPNELKNKLIYNAADRVVSEALRDCHDTCRYHPYPPPPAAPAVAGRNNGYNNRRGRP